MQIALFWFLELYNVVLGYWNSRGNQQLQVCDIMKYLLQ